MGAKLIRNMLAECDALVEEAASLAGPYNPAELDVFAARLCGLGGLPQEEVERRVADLKVPGDFRHLRLTNLTRNIDWGGAFDCEQQPIAMDDLILDLLMAAEHEEATEGGPGLWIETVALPIRDPGVLELGLVFASLH